MTTILKSLVLWLHMHPTWAGVVTFAITLFESLAILGLLLPGSVVLTAIGGLIGSGIIPAVDIFIWAIAGAIIGDGLSYWLGYHYHTVIRKIWPISRFPKLIAKGEAFFHKHGRKSIFIGRFVGALRPVMPLIGGMLRMRPANFFPVDIVSGILWAPIYMLPGILVGAASAHFAPDQALHFILILLLIIFIIWLLFWLSKLITKLLLTQWGRYADYLWKKASTQKSIIYTLLYEHEQPLRSRPLSIACFTIISAIIFLLLLISVLFQATWLHSLNLSTLNFFESLHAIALQHIAIGMSIYLGKINVILGTAILITIYFAIKRDWHAFWHFIALLFLSIAGAEACKLLTHNIRPQVTITPPTTYSFTSGHVLFSLMLFGFIAFLIAHNNKKWIKKFSYSFVMLIVVLVMLSRLYLNVHWLGDVIGSVLLGGCILSIIVIAYRRKEQHNRYRALPLLIILIVGQALFGSWYYAKHAKILQRNFQLIEAPHYINETDWWGTSHSLLPIYRHNRFAKPIQILNIQWMGSLTSIKASLQQRDWKKPNRFGLRTLKQQLLGKKLMVLPPLTQQLKHHKPILVMIKPLAEKNVYLILHLWNINYHTAIEPIYLGNISYHFPVKHWLWHHQQTCHIIYDAATFQLQKNLRGWNYKSIAFKEKYSLKHHPCVQKKNKILLIRGKLI